MSGFLFVSYILLWVLVAVQFVLIVLLYRQLGLIYLGTQDGVNRDGLEVGAAVPSFTLPTLTGEARSLADYQDRPVLLVFGAPYCEPCQTLTPQLNELAREQAGNLHVLLVSHGSLEENKLFNAKYHLGIPMLLSPDSKLMERFKARVTPFAFVIGSDGKVLSKGLVNNRTHLERLLHDSGLTTAATRAS